LTDNDLQHDPFLWAHEIIEHVYDIATGLRPFSVRDQVTRARLLIRRALELGIIGAGDQLVISGAGVAGAVCAYEATKRGVRVLLVEKEPYAFHLQRHCVTRTVDPNLFDWPARTWESLEYPTQKGDDAPLWFKVRERPRAIASRWASQLQRIAERRPDLLTIQYCVSIAWLDPGALVQNTRTVTFRPAQGHSEEIPQHTVSVSGPVQAAMVVIAEGPGKEIETLPSFRVDEQQDSEHVFHGYRFWDTDPFDVDPLKARRLLIVGSGDGALQDFLRVLFRPGTDLRLVLNAFGLPDSLLADIRESRHHNVAAFLWCADRRHEHDSDRFVHQLHATMVDALFKDSVTRLRILQTVRKWLRPTLPKVVLAHACDHFTHGFPLNRFLALTVARAMTVISPGSVEVRSMTFVTAINCQHSAAKVRFRSRRRQCYAQPHEALFASGKCFDQPPQASAEDSRDVFDGIILRLGPEGRSTAGGSPWPHRHPEKPLRQLLPPHLAHQPSTITRP
jgi:hypothetical protein